MPATSTSAVTSPTARPWLVGIEAMRGVAAGSVVAHHIWSLSGYPQFTGSWIFSGFGWWGVALFFMLSGFLLADTFWQPAKPGRMEGYAVRRFARIAPAYYVNVGILYLFFAVHDLVFSEQGIKQLIANATFTQYLFPSTTSNLNVNGALWTLTIEMTLYVAMPVLSLLVLRTRGWILPVIIGTGVAWRLLVSYWDALERFYFPPEFGQSTLARLFISRQFPGILTLFGLGIGLKWLLHIGALRAPRLPRVLTRGSRTLPIVLALVPSVVWMYWGDLASNFQRPKWFAGFDLVLGALFGIALLVAACPATPVENPLGRMVDRGAEWLGVRSYGLYLWHFPIILSVLGIGPMLNWPAPNATSLMRIVTIVVLSLLAAALSWTLVEQPAQQAAKRWLGERRTSR